MNRNSLPLRGWLAICSIALVATAGCSQSPYEMAPVRGSVTVDGTPLTACQVMFAPRATERVADSGKPAIGWLDDEGKFELSTYSEGDGAVVGEHLVTLFGPADAAELPPGIPKFKRVAVQGEAILVEAGKDNEVNITLSLKDLQPLKISGLQLKQ